MTPLWPVSQDEPRRDPHLFWRDPAGTPCHILPVRAPPAGTCRVLSSRLAPGGPDCRDIAGARPRDPARRRALRAREGALVNRARAALAGAIGSAVAPSVEGRGHHRAGLRPEAGARDRGRRCADRRRARGHRRAAVPAGARRRRGDWAARGRAPAGHRVPALRLLRHRRRKLVTPAQRGLRAPGAGRRLLVPDVHDVAPDRAPGALGGQRARSWRPGWRRCPSRPA